MSQHLQLHFHLFLNTTQTFISTSTSASPSNPPPTTISIPNPASLYLTLTLSLPPPHAHPRIHPNASFTQPLFSLPAPSPLQSPDTVPPLAPSFLHAPPSSDRRIPQNFIFLLHLTSEARELTRAITTASLHHHYRCMM